MGQIGAKCTMRIKQIEESKKLISDAFIWLLQDKSMDEITVSQIAAQAKIGRNTFYNHFQKKEDVLNYIMQGCFDEVKENMRQIDNPSIRDLLIWRFAIVKENPLLKVFQNQSDIKQLLFQFRDNHVQKLNITEHKSDNGEYTMDFYQGGIDYVMSRWIANGMKKPADEMADKILSLMNM